MTNKENELSGWESSKDLPETFQEKYNRYIEQTNAQICERWQIPFPFDEHCKNVSQAFYEALERAILAEYCVEHDINWSLYQELRGYLFSKRK